MKNSTFLFKDTTLFPVNVYYEMVAVLVKPRKRSEFVNCHTSLKQYFNDAHVVIKYIFVFLFFEILHILVKYTCTYTCSKE